MTRPDPLDVLKFAYVTTYDVLETTDDDALIAQRECLEALIEPLLGPDFDLDDLRYSDGRCVSIHSEYAHGRYIVHHVLPPGYPTRAGAGA